MAPVSPFRAGCRSCSRSRRVLQALSPHYPIAPWAVRRLSTSPTAPATASGDRSRDQQVVRRSRASRRPWHWRPLPDGGGSISATMPTAPRPSNTIAESVALIKKVPLSNHPQQHRGDQERRSHPWPAIARGAAVCVSDAKTLTPRPPHEHPGKGGLHNITSTLTASI